MLRSLRARLAVLVFVAVAAPVLVLAVVSVRVTADAEVTIVDGERIVSDVEVERDPASEWVWLTAGGLVVLAAGVAWVLSGRVTEPIERIRRTADRIEASEMGERLDLDRGPEELIALARSFDRMLDRIEAAADAQRDFVAKTSHELRTPLAVLQTNIDLLRSDPDADLEAHREASELTHRSLARLRSLVDDLLLAGRAGAQRLEVAPVTVGQLLDGVPDDDRVLVPELSDDVTVEVDRLAVMRAVANLVDNALSAGPGDLHIGVGTIDRWLVLGVRDRGRGIAEEHHATLTQPYVRVPGTETPGTGLGLTIVEQIALAHGGALTLRSEVGEGSTMLLWLAIGPVGSAVPTHDGVHHDDAHEHRLAWG